MKLLVKESIKIRTICMIKKIEGKFSTSINIKLTSRRRSKIVTLSRNSSININRTTNTKAIKKKRKQQIGLNGLY